MERPQRQRRSTYKVKARANDQPRAATSAHYTPPNHRANTENDTREAFGLGPGRVKKLTHLHDDIGSSNFQTGAFQVVGPACFSHAGNKFSGDMSYLDRLLEKEEKQEFKIRQLIRHKLMADTRFRWDQKPYLQKDQEISSMARRKACKAIEGYEYETSDSEGDDMFDVSLEAQGTEEGVAAARVRNRHRLRVLKARLDAVLAPLEATSGEETSSSRKPSKGRKQRDTASTVHSRQDSKAAERLAAAERTLEYAATLSKESPTRTGKEKNSVRRMGDLQIDMVDAPSCPDLEGVRATRSKPLDTKINSRHVGVVSTCSALVDEMSEPCSEVRMSTEYTNRPKRTPRPSEKVRLADSRLPSHTAKNRLNEKRACGALSGEQSLFPAMSDSRSSSQQGTKRKAHSSSDSNDNAEPKKGRLKLTVRAPVEETATERVAVRKLKLTVRHEVDKTPAAGESQTSHGSDGQE